MVLPRFGGAAGSILTGLTAVAMVSLQLAYAHGPAEWIQRGGFKNAAGELCCGERDCFELTDADVKITSAGYYVLTGDCNPDVTAKIDFGVTNPVIAPTYARVTLTGPGCPCTMAAPPPSVAWASGRTIGFSK